MGGSRAMVAEFVAMVVVLLFLLIVMECGVRPEVLRESFTQPTAVMIEP